MMTGTDLFQRFHAVVGLDHLEALQLQVHAHKADHARFVVYDQDDSVSC
jgi:hypothetical protein